MDERNLTLTVLGIVVVISIVGLVLLFSMAGTGAGVYGGALKGDPFPYTRYIEGQPLVESPGYQTTMIDPTNPVFGGADEALINYEPVPREVQKGVTYKRDPALKTRTAKITCTTMRFPNNVYAPISSNQQQWESYTSMGRKCFKKNVDGEKVIDLIGSLACCTR
ncbi:hypothetical protein KY333_02210 [Candidatus Woesearchaeota archaeon]|nr:hypothetical protein [Candidatus Woesearchaeota archaeon]